MSDQPWMKFYPRDWRGDQALRAVSLAARGLWMECLCIMHEAKPYGSLLLNGNPISNATLARMVGSSEDDVARLMGELIEAGVASLLRGIVVSRRMQKDHCRSEKGKKSVEKRWSQDAEKSRETDRPNRPPTTHIPEARSQSTEEGSDLRSSPSARSVAPAGLPLSLKRDDPGFALTLVEGGKKPSKGNGADPPGFAEFWRHYPRKVGKDAARRAYASALKRGATPTELVQGAMRYAAERDGEDSKFTAHPTTWLNGGCWMDEPAPPKPRPGEATARAAMMALGMTEDDFR